MDAFFITDSGESRLRRQDLRSGYPENWLQDLVFREPGLIPMAQIEPGAGKLIPICREFLIPKHGSTGVKLDILAMTPLGRPVLIECKLWRNPQARREVVAQIVEYAALMRGWSYGDLTARIAIRNTSKSDNPLYDMARAAGSPLAEAAFCDAVSKNLRDSSCQMIVIGDGIREDMITIADHLGATGARLALLELQIWARGPGELLVIPQIPFRTEVFRQRLLVDIADRVIALADDSRMDPDMQDFSEVDTERAAYRADARLFWQSFIEQANFVHPDQAQPRHGGHNWVKIPMPSPARWLLAYKNANQTGLSLVVEDGSDLLAILGEEASAIADEIAPWSLKTTDMRSQEPRITSVCPDGTDEMTFLLDASNKLVSALRPRISHIEDRA